MELIDSLKVKGYAVEGDADMNICMGSDDPGIFATDIKNEYYHLYMSLRNVGLSAQESIEKLKRVNDAGRTFAFRELPDMQYTTFNLISLLNHSPRSQRCGSTGKMRRTQIDLSSVRNGLIAADDGQ